MKVILLEDVKKVGKKNEIIDTTPGYAKNFLIKNKKAVDANEKNLANLEKLLKKNKEQYDIEVKEAKELKTKLENKVFEFHLSMGNHGMVFGKVSTKQIVSKLKEEGYEIDRKKIKTDGVNHLGEETIDIELHKEVVAKVKINVVGE